MATKYLLLAFLCIFSGCTPGWIYTNRVTPACLNMDKTPIGEKQGTSGWKQINIPRIPGARSIWSSNAIADAAAREGITHVEYCDRKQFSLFGGLWGRDSIVVYGR